MAKKKRLTKIEPPKEDPMKGSAIICYRCGRVFSRLQGSFPSVKNHLWRGIGYLPVCINCVDELFNSYYMQTRNEAEAMRRLCMNFDLYWDNSLYESVKSANIKSTPARSYIVKLNTAKYSDFTFSDTLLKEKSQYEAMRITNELPEEIEIPEEVVAFWGMGYTVDFYLELERRYAEWTNGATDIQPNEKSLYRQICLLETIISRDGAQGKAVDKNINTLNTLLGSMNLKPAQKKPEQEYDLEKMPLGVGLQKWEEMRPLPPVPEDQKDVSGLIKNINTWYLGHTCKMVGLKNSYSKLYENAMNELRVEHPEYSEEDDDTMLNDIFGKVSE